MHMLVSLSLEFQVQIDMSTLYSQLLQTVVFFDLFAGNAGVCALLSHVAPVLVLGHGDKRPLRGLVEPQAAVRAALNLRGVLLQQTPRGVRIVQRKRLVRSPRAGRSPRHVRNIVNL